MNFEIIQNFTYFPRYMLWLQETTDERIKVRRWEGVNLAGCFSCERYGDMTWISELSAVLILRWKHWELGCVQRVVFMMWVGRVSAVLSEIWRVTILSDSSFDVWPFVDYFIAMFEIESGLKNLLGKTYDWLKKRTFLIVNLFSHFNRMDARSLPAQRHVLFILLKPIVQTTSG